MIQKVLGVLLLVGGLYFGYSGLQAFQESTNEVNVLGIELKANDESGQQAGIIQLVMAAVLFAGGIYLIRKT